MHAATPGPDGFPAAAASRAPGPGVAPEGVCEASGGPNSTWSPAAGFGEGGALDALRPGADLAVFAESAWTGGFGALSDDELTGLIRAWRRLSSWAAAGELAAVAELSGRRERAAQPGSARLGCAPVDYVADELACALTLTRRSAENLAERAGQLAGLPATAAALENGQIDMPKALTIIDAAYGTDAGVALAVEDLVLTKAPQQTTGELRAALRRAVLTADPAAARRRREAAEKTARVELWDEPAGTKALAGRDLPPAGVLAADKRIAAIARDLKSRGADGTLELVRAKVYLALLAGQPLAGLLPAQAGTSECSTGGSDAGARCATGGRAASTEGAPRPARADVGHAGAQRRKRTAIRPGESRMSEPELGESAAGEPGVFGSATDVSAAGRLSSGESGVGESATGSATGSATLSLAAGSLSSGRLRTGGSGVGGSGVGGCVVGESEVGESATGFAMDRSAAEGSSMGDLARLAGWINLTVPLATLLDLAEAPGEVAGFGPVDAGAARLLVDAAAPNPATRWCVTVTDDEGHTIGHGCRCRERAGPPAGNAAQRAKPPGRTASKHTGIVIKLNPLAFTDCDHRLEAGAYTPSPRLRHLIEIRDRICCFPICRHPAAKCDKDHTIPYGQGGRTCLCNLTPLCRTHHQLKQSLGWRLRQPSPGAFEWIAPSGRKYLVGRW